MKSKSITGILLILCCLCIVLTGCPATETERGAVGEGPDWSGVTIDGAGASFPFPIYSQWAFEYEELTGLRLNYQSVGSGAGISSIREGTVNFGASDAPLTAEELEADGLIQFPMIIGGVVPVINVSGVTAGSLKLTPDVLADMFLGNITIWNDPRIVQANPDVTLPDQAISIVHRADGSGTTWIFTNYLSAISDEWADGVGVGKSVDWPTGVGGRGNEGVANYVGQVDGSIGYVEYAYALQNDMAHCLLGNSAGNFVAPTSETFIAAAANADWENAPGYYLVLVDQPGEDTWPIVGASFILIYKEQENMDKVRAMLEFFDWCFKNGTEDALDLDYVPIPENVVEMVETTWSEEVKVNGEQVWE